jgi:hypothetical protein
MRWFRVPLLCAAAGTVFGNMVFAAVIGVAWPARPPAWTARVISAIFLLSVIVAGLAAFGFWQESRRKR